MYNLDPRPKYLEYLHTEVRFLHSWLLNSGIEVVFKLKTNELQKFDKIATLVA